MRKVSYTQNDCFVYINTIMYTRAYMRIGDVSFFRCRYRERPISRCRYSFETLDLALHLAMSLLQRHRISAILPYLISANSVAVASQRKFFLKNSCTFIFLFLTLSC